MRPWLVALIVLVAAALVVAFSARPAALGSLVDITAATVRSDKHHVPMLRCGRLSLRASHNHTVIGRAAQYAGAIGSNTSVYLGIAEAAADLDEECPDLERVLDLSVMTLSSGPTILALARSACRAETEEEARRWEEILAALWAAAEFPDAETALAARSATP